MNRKRKHTILLGMTLTLTMQASDIPRQQAVLEKRLAQLSKYSKSAPNLSRLHNEHNSKNPVTTSKLYSRRSARHACYRLTDYISGHVTARNVIGALIALSLLTFAAYNQS